MDTAQVLYLKPEEYPNTKPEEYYGIEIDRTKDKELSEQAKKLLKDYYQIKEEVLSNIRSRFTRRSY